MSITNLLSICIQVNSERHLTNLFRTLVYVNIPVTRRNQIQNWSITLVFIIVQFSKGMDQRCVNFDKENCRSKIELMTQKSSFMTRLGRISKKIQGGGLRTRSNDLHLDRQSQRQKNKLRKCILQIQTRSCSFMCRLFLD